MDRKKDIIIHQKSHASVTIECNPTISRELSQFFSSYATNYRFSPLYKSKQWDGKIYFFKIATNELPIGLVEKCYDFARIGNYTIECTYERFNNIKREDLQKFIESLNIPFPLRDYQFEAVYQCVCKKHINVHANTSSGKSLIIYVVIRFMIYMKLKSLIIVPATQLVEQMFGDFISYGWKDAERYCHRVYGDQRKFFDAPVIIACWQSMISTKVKKENPYESFDCILIDENHLGSAKSISELSKICINAEYRFGFSGTYPEPSIADWYTIVGSTGPIKTFTTYSKLEADGHITPLKIYNILLSYDKEFKQKVYKECGTDYQLQGNMIHNNEKRNLFILKMLQNLKENCLILFTKKEGHGYGIKELLENELKDKLLIYIDGDVSVEERESARKIMEERNDVVLLATYGLMSTGVSIKNLYSIIFASGYKSKTKVLQSIGRVLRLSPGKEYAKLFDLVDDVSFQDRVNHIRFINHSMNHYKDRLEFYRNENWNVKTVKYTI
jgi:superfamily II DNA or RNA helicase